MLWRLPYTFRSASFFKFRFFGQSKDPNEISNVKKESLKTIKYWQRNGGFKFWPEVKIIRLIDIFSIVFWNQFFNFNFNFIYSFIHGKKIHQVHKCLKIPKAKNTNPIITLIYNKATYRLDFHEYRVFKNIDGEGA